MTSLSSSELATTLTLARDLMIRREFEQAELVLLEGLSLSHALHGPESREAMQITEKLGVCLQRMRRYSEAVTYLRQAYLYWLGNHCDSAETIVYVARHLGPCLTEAGLHAEAIPILRTVIDECARLYGSDCKARFYLISRLSISLRAKRDWQSLVAQHQSAEQEAAINEGRSVPHILTIWRNIGVGYLELKQPDEALKLIFKVLKVERKRSNLRNLESLGDLRFASIVLFHSRRYDEAIDLLEKAIELALPAHGIRPAYRKMLTEELDRLRQKIERRLKHEARMAAQAARKLEVQSQQS